jgi:hypothetical protein
VEQLGDDETIIRVGGKFAMERFALDAFALSGVERDTDWRLANGARPSGGLRSGRSSCVKMVVPAWSHLED